MNLEVSEYAVGLIRLDRQVKEFWEHGKSKILLDWLSRTNFREEKKRNGFMETKS
jgi:hypothetical protein